MLICASRHRKASPDTRRRGKVRRAGALLSLAAALLAAPLAADDTPGFISLDGFVPPGVDRIDLQVRYVRIWDAIAPRLPADRSPLSIQFYTRAMGGNAAFLLPEWGGGGAIGTSLLVVAIDVSPLLDQDPLRVAVHEMVHIALTRAYPGLGIPRWFHEGVALLLSGEVPSEEQVAISRAILTGSLLGLASIDSVNSFGRSRASLAYAQGHQTVLYLVETYSMEIIPEALAAARARGGFWQGVDSVLAVTPQELESHARAALTQRFRWAFFVADNELLWLGTAALFCIAVIVAVVRRRRKMRLLAAAEAAALEEENRISGGAPPDSE